MNSNNHFKHSHIRIYHKKVKILEDRFTFFVKGAMTYHHHVFGVCLPKPGKVFVDKIQ